jgi:hypothetical protein
LALATSNLKDHRADPPFDWDTIHPAIDPLLALDHRSLVTPDFSKTCSILETCLPLPRFQQPQDSLARIGGGTWYILAIAAFAKAQIAPRTILNRPTALRTIP